MTYALLILDNPDQNQQTAWQGWQTLLSNHIDPNIGNDRIDRVTHNAFLLNLKIVLPIFGDIIAHANQHNIHYESLFFEKKPSFSPPITDLDTA